MSDRERSSPTLIETGLKNLIGGRDGNYPLISGINVAALRRISNTPMLWNAQHDIRVPMRNQTLQQNLAATTSNVNVAAAAAAAAAAATVSTNPHSIFGTGNFHYKTNNSWSIPSLSCYQRLYNENAHYHAQRNFNANSTETATNINQNVSSLVCNNNNNNNINNNNNTVGNGNPNANNSSNANTNSVLGNVSATTTVQHVANAVAAAVIANEHQNHLNNLKSRFQPTSTVKLFSVSQAVKQAGSRGTIGDFANNNNNGNTLSVANINHNHHATANQLLRNTMQSVVANSQLQQTINNLGNNLATLPPSSQLLHHHLQHLASVNANAAAAAAAVAVVSNNNNPNNNHNNSNNTNNSNSNSSSPLNANLLSTGASGNGNNNANQNLSIHLNDNLIAHNLVNGSYLCANVPKHAEHNPWMAAQT
uniref:Uncharacterized protein n=1 Tax=Glossina morsitans morsitans TaxID=37546 RepID=A0A1B0FRL4_GLOMM